MSLQSCFSPTVTPSVPLTFCSAVGSGDRVLVPKIFVFSPLVSQRIHAHASVYRAFVLSFDRTAHPPCETRFNCRPEDLEPSSFLVSLRVCGKAMSGISSPHMCLWLLAGCCPEQLGEQMVACTSLHSVRSPLSLLMKMQMTLTVTIPSCLRSTS